MTILRSIEESGAVYGRPKGGAVFKEIAFLNAHYRAFVEASPFVILGSAGQKWPRLLPEGRSPGFVRVLDEKTLALPDRLGNNRIDTLRNLVIDPRIALLFVVPRPARPCASTAGRRSRPMPSSSPLSRSRKAPRSVILVTVEAAYVHCAKAFMRSKLWERRLDLERSDLPSMAR